MIVLPPNIENMDDALILIPCCKVKRVTPSRGPGHRPPFDLGSSRSGLLSRIRETAEIAGRKENLDGILNEAGTPVQAVGLYDGHFYRKTHDVLRAIARGDHPSLHLFIVSALYGLVDLNEPLKTYDLMMGEKLHGGLPVWRYWQENGLAEKLEEYVEGHAITHIWSLLPDSKPAYPYQQVFEAFWDHARDTDVRCVHVTSPGAGSGSGARRAAWLHDVVTRCPGHLCQDELPLDRTLTIAGYDYLYRRC